MKKKLTIGILAHVDAGKTTLSVRRVGDDRLIPEVLKSLLDTAQIAHAVVDDGDHEGTPALDNLAR